MPCKNHPDRKIKASELCQPCYLKEWGTIPKNREKKRQRSRMWWQNNRQRHLKGQLKAYYKRQLPKVILRLKRWQAIYPQLKITFKE